MNEYSINIGKLKQINIFLNKVVDEYNNNYDYVKLNIDSFKKWLYNELTKNKVFFNQNIKNSKGYNYNLTNDLLYYIQYRRKNEEISLKHFIDFLNDKPHISNDDNILINYSTRILRYYQKYIVEQLILANYENNSQYVLAQELVNYINNGATKNLYRYRINDKVNYRKCLIENVNPNELYMVIFSRLMEMNRDYKYQDKSKEEIISDYVNYVLVNHQKKLLNYCVNNCYNLYGLMKTIDCLINYINKTNSEFINVNKENSGYIKKYLKPNNLLEIINQVLNNQGIDTSSMDKEEIIDTYVYNIGRELGKTL